MNTNDLFNHLKKNPMVRASANENAARRSIAEKIYKRLDELGWTEADLLKVPFVDKDMVSLILHKEVGWTLSLQTIFLVADALGLDVEINFTGGGEK